MKGFKFFIAILLYPVLALVSLAFTFFSMIFFNWVVVLFCDEKGFLPGWAKLWATFDASCDEGMLARKRYLASVSPAGQKSWDEYVALPEDAWDYYRNRVKWLNRNPGYGIDYWLFGFAWFDHEWSVVKFEHDQERTFFVAVGPAFNIYYAGPRGIYKLGWKAWNNFNADTKTWKAAEDPTRFNRAVLTASVNPFWRKK